MIADWLEEINYGSSVIFYGQADDPDMGHLTMRVIPVGRITSDLSIFDELDSRMELHLIINKIIPKGRFFCNDIVTKLCLFEGDFLLS